MNILVTGARGFVGKNLICALRNIKSGKDRTRPNLKIDNIYEFDIDKELSELDDFCKDCDFVFNLAGVNRPQNKEDFMEGNCNFVSTLLDTLKRNDNKCPIMVSSSIQASLNNEYGLSKKAGEDVLIDYGKETGANVIIYRFPNLFGKWCRPNYNSVVATFCNNIANDLPIQVNDRTTELTLVYIDDLIYELLNLIEKRGNILNNGFGKVEIEHKVTLGEIVDLLLSFSNQPKTLVIPSVPVGSFAKKLYSTYLSYLPKEKIKYDVKMNFDDRGSFTEIFKTAENGQFSVNVSKPGVTKGEHWHNSKWEFFVVVSGHALIQERNIFTDDVLNFEVSGEKIEVVHMIPGYAHNIVNLSNEKDLVTLMWANEVFDNEHPDTFREYVGE